MTNKEKEIKELAEAYSLPEDYICPECLCIMEEQWDNVGFTEPEGPSKWEIVCLKCPNCGHEET